MNEGALEEVWRRSTPAALAALVRRYGDFDAAEDAMQEALLVAATRWPSEGVPDDPKAWLITVASRRLIDRLRSEGARADREELVVRRAPTEELIAPAADAAEEARDDTLALFLLCCHPSLSTASQVALTLRAVAGLTTAQIARAFLVPEATMAQRISRAKQRLRQEGARFPPPAAEQMPERVAAVAHVLYLVFTEAHTSTEAAGLTEPRLADEAIRLTRELHDRLPGDGEVAGLLALMLLTDARSAARVRADGTLVLLSEQDRSLWDTPKIREGTGLVERALPAGPVGPFQLQAAIAAVHAEAASAEDTDWLQIEILYRMLGEVAPSDVVTLNHAVALAMVDGPNAGLKHDRADAGRSADGSPPPAPCRACTSARDGWP